jgi:hypothetical protein
MSDDDNAGAIQARAKQRRTLDIERGRRLKGESNLELRAQHDICCDLFANDLNRKNLFLNHSLYQNTKLRTVNRNLSFGLLQ